MPVYGWKWKWHLLCDKNVFLFLLQKTKILIYELFEKETLSVCCSLYLGNLNLLQTYAEAFQLLNSSYIEIEESRNELNYKKYIITNHK